MEALQNNSEQDENQIFLNHFRELFYEASENLRRVERTWLTACGQATKFNEPEPPEPAKVKEARKECDERRKTFEDYERALILERPLPEIYKNFNARPIQVKQSGWERNLPYRVNLNPGMTFILWLDDEVAMMHEIDKNGFSKKIEILRTKDVRKMKEEMTALGKPFHEIWNHEKRFKQ